VTKRARGAGRSRVRGGVFDQVRSVRDGVVHGDPRLRHLRVRYTGTGPRGAGGVPAAVTAGSST
jgi:hypothetical protein